ncbi:cation:dicarboxylate symporter family transporter [Priestia megaterium]|uniref:cation:dicarboxylate symporter family transporter n=1 Tax=Priestia megaterium TaxID=1404 RepID=UPI003A813282
MKLSTKIIIALIAGAVVGVLINAFAPLDKYLFTPLGQIFLSLIKMLVVPIVFFSITLGVAGVPGVGLIMLAMVLSSVGLPVAGIGLIIGIDRLLDMLRTSVNITGDAACAVIVAESEAKRIDKSVTQSA